MFAPKNLLADLAAALADPTIRALDNPLASNGVIDNWKRYPVIQLQQTATKQFSFIPA